MLRKGDIGSRKHDKMVWTMESTIITHMQLKIDIYISYSIYSCITFKIAIYVVCSSKLLNG